MADLNFRRQPRPETLWAYKKLKADYVVGGMTTYAALKEAMHGLDPQELPGRGCVLRARKWLLGRDQMATQAVENQGIAYPDTAGVLNLGKKRRRHVRVTARAGIREINTLDPAKLSRDERRDMFQESMLLRMHEYVERPQVERRIRGSLPSIDLKITTASALQIAATVSHQHEKQKAARRRPDPPTVDEKLNPLRKGA